MKIFITGGAGTCGSVLKDLAHEKIFFDLKDKPSYFKDHEYITGNLSDQDLLSKSMQNCDVLIHLAAKDYYPDFRMGAGEVSWEDYSYNNIHLTKQLFDQAIKSGIKKVIYASTHRVQGMYEKKYSPKIYELGHSYQFNHLSEVCPDSIYAVTKLFGENIARYFSTSSNTIFKCVRICSVRDEDNDNPFAYAEYGVKQGLWSRESKEYNIQKNRLKGLWQSRRDFLQMIDKIIISDKKEFEIFYGLSNNDRKWFDIKYSKDSINYCPLDNSENC